MSAANFPVLIGESVQGAIDGKERFPFRSWASANRFTYPERAETFLTACGSAAEAWFARPFVLRDGVTYPAENWASAGDLSLKLQVLASRYRIDAVVSDARTSIAIEIDGMRWHHRTREQIAEDYLRERRLVLVGHTVIRFTAQEVFRDVAECWRQVELILQRRGRAS